MSFCARCGSRMEDADQFCQSCGTRRESAAAVMPAAQSAAPTPDYSPYTTPDPPRKRSAVKWFVIGGIVLVLAALVLVIVKVVGGLSGRAPDGADARLYTAVSAELWGVQVAVEDVYPDGFAIELFDGGRCRILIGNKDYSGEWESENGAFHLEGRGLDCEGTFDEDVIVLEDVMGSGVDMIFLREGAALPAAAGAPTGSAAAKAFWSGDWYGWWSISGQTGAYAEWDGDWWDCCASIEPLEGERVLLTMWDEDYPKEDPVARVELELMGSDSGAVVSAVSREGVFWNSKVEDYDYEITPDDQPYENAIIFTGVNSDDKGSFEYTVFLRPWGQDWSDVDEDDMPYYYDWYREQLAGGALHAPTGRLNDYLG